MTTNILQSRAEGEQGFHLFHIGSNVPLLEDTDDTRFKLYLCFCYPIHASNLFSRFSEYSSLYHFHHCLLFTKKHARLNFSSNKTTRDFSALPLIGSVFPVFMISTLFIKCSVFTYSFFSVLRLD